MRVLGSSWSFLLASTGESVSHALISRWSRYIQDIVLLHFVPSDLHMQDISCRSSPNAIIYSEINVRGKLIGHSMCHSGFRTVHQRYDILNCHSLAVQSESKWPAWTGFASIACCSILGAKNYLWPGLVSIPLIIIYSNFPKAIPHSKHNLIHPHNIPC